MATLGGVKAEEKSIIKPEPDTDGLDEDVYEDTGECTIPPPGQEPHAWLARLPKWLWEAWSDIAEDEEIELGKIRVYNNGPPNKTKIKLVLNDIPGHAAVPKRYDMDMTKTDYNNTIVFSERDQPGFSGGQGWNRTRPKQQKKSDRSFANEHKIGKGGYRSSIPKQTSLAAYLKHEVSVMAVQDDEYHRVSDRWLKSQKKTTNRTRFNLGSGIAHLHHPGAQTGLGMGSFTSSSAKLIKQRRMQEKAVRIPEDELLRQLIDCFKEYRYWSLRALKQRLKQPEVHIKNVIPKIASLVRSGTFAMNYELNPEYAAIYSASVSQQAAEEGDTDDDLKMEDADGDGDDADDFEDVKMGED